MALRPYGAGVAGGSLASASLYTVLNAAVAPSYSAPLVESVCVPPEVARSLEAILVECPREVVLGVLFAIGPGWDLVIWLRRRWVRLTREGRRPLYG